MANKFIIDPQSISYLEVRNDLVDYFNSLPDADEWSLFLSSSAGQRIIDLVAAIAAFNKLDSITARREGFIQFAQNRASIIGKAQDLGYSAYRGRNTVLKLTITPIITGVISKYSYLGTLKDRYLIMESDVVVNAGVPIDVNVIVGEVKEEILFATTSALSAFRFHNPDVSEDLRLYIDEVEVEWGSEVQDALDDKFQVQSNTFRSVDAKYLNQSSAATQYIVGSEIKLEYIDLKDISYTNTDVKVYDTIATLSNIEVVSLFQDVESESSIKINAPIKNELSSAVRGREDQPKIFRTLHPDILDAAGVDVTDAVMKIYVLRDGGYTFSASEFADMQAEFEKYRPNGLYPPLLENAQSSEISLSVLLTLKSGSTTQPNALVAGVLDEYKDKLGANLSLIDIEDSLEDDDGVKIARVSVTASVWQAVLSYKQGSYVSPTIENGFVYRVKQIRSKSDSIEPTWPVVAGDTVIDNQIVWKAIAKDDLAGIDNWAADTFYEKADIAGFNLGSIVKPSIVNGFVYEAVDYVYLSGSSAPTWSSTLGDKVIDNRILWVVKTLVGAPANWAADTSYKLGDTVKISDVGYETVMFQAVAYLDKSGAVEPTWPTVSGSAIADENLVWEAQSKTASQALTNDRYFSISYSVTVN